MNGREKWTRDEVEAPGRPEEPEWSGLQPSVTHLASNIKTCLMAAKGWDYGRRLHLGDPKNV